MLDKKRIASTFLELIKIDSPSGEEKKVAEYITRVLKKYKVKTYKDKYGNLIGYAPGEGRPIMLSAHMDTVEPGRGIKPRVKGDVIKSDGRTILGADDKAGITAILEAAKYLRENKSKHRALELVFTREEETGLKGAFNLNYKKIKSKEGLVIDSCRPLGHLTIAAPFIYSIDIRVHGKAAHAGAFPERGINAIAIAAKAIGELKIGRISPSTTNNIGIINGGSVRNCVPETVNIKAEARSHYLKEAQKQVDLMNKAFKKYVRQYRAKLYFKAALGCHGYSYLKNEPMIKKIAQLNQKMNIKTVYEKSGGGSDANVLAGKGIKAIDIAYGGNHVHTVKETIRIGELTKLTQFIIEFIKK